jgi:lon-related putative ATP-dependent protease
VTGAPPLPAPLPAERLHRTCRADELGFETTAEVEPIWDGIGQKRADAAVRLALGMKHRGYNLFALGPAGAGKFAFVHSAAEKAAATWPLPSDWCYLNNFAEPHRPRALALPAGRARALALDMEHLVEDLRAALPAAFESEEYRNRKTVIQEHAKERQEQVFSDLQSRARQQDVALVRTPMGLALAPIRDGEVLSPQEFEQLPAEDKQRRQQSFERLQKELQEFLQTLPRWEKEQREQIRELDRDVTLAAVGAPIEDVKRRWADQPAVLAHLEAVRQDVIDNVDDFVPKEQGPQIVIGPQGRGPSPADQLLRRYRVNVLVDQSRPLAGGNGTEPRAPIVYEDHPTLANLVGRIEHQAQFGTLVTDFTLIKAGALHRANGGCLILDVRKLLTNPFAYETLKRALRSGCIRIESIAEQIGWTTTTILEPEPIPLDVKVALLGEPMLYYLLSIYDPEFSELFRVAADFETEMDRDLAGTTLYVRMLAALVRRLETRPLDRSGAARLVDHASRLASDAQKLATHTDTIEDVIREADFWAGDAGAVVISGEHVQQAIDARTFRSDRLRERVQEAIRRGTLVVESSGARVGQVNGLAVISLNNFAFGKPSRISCQVRLGKGEVIDIEREVALSGPLHAKGVLILGAYLGGRYARQKPLSLSASLVFEQSYSGVEGDSASSAELYALLSALSEIPIKQSLAVTGSVDQQGRVQAIGGVTEKIEGFFDVCAARGLTGEQGVLIPAANVEHLMLRRDVVDACAEGRFHVFPVETIDQGIALLTGVPAGEADAAGEYPRGTVNHAVANRLAQLTRAALKFAAVAEGKKKSRRNAEEAEKGSLR